MQRQLPPEPFALNDQDIIVLGDVTAEHIPVKDRPADLKPELPKDDWERLARFVKEKGGTLVILAGKEYGTGSSRDWAAKGTMLLGVKAVIAESFERIHRSNLIGMGVLPLQYKEGQSTQSLGLTGKETFEIVGLNRGAAKTVKVIAKSADGKATEFDARLRIDTPKELDYYQHGGILQYVLRQLANLSKAA